MTLNKLVSDIVLITDRGYELVRNLEMYIDKGQRMIMGPRSDRSLSSTRFRLSVTSEPTRMGWKCTG